MRTATLLLAGLGLFATAVLVAQPAAPQQFDIATIKTESVPPPPFVRWILPQANDPQHFQSYSRAMDLIRWAYAVKEFQVSGPEWLARAVFDVQATTARPSSETAMRQMLQTLLADRFKLKLHREVREFLIYALVADKDGVKIPLVAAEAGQEDRGEGAFEIGRGHLDSRGGTMSGLAMVLTHNVDRPVIDKTNLTGHYDFDLNYDPTGRVGFPFGAAIFAPIQTLDLKLEPQTETFEVLVIDAVERPSEK